MCKQFLNKKFMNFCTKDSFHALIKDHSLVFRQLHDSLSRGKWFLIIASFYLCSFLTQSITFGLFQKCTIILYKLLQYERGCAVPIRHIFATSDDVQYKQGRSSVLAERVLPKNSFK